MKILLILIISILFCISNVNAQKLNKTDILQDDIYLYPPHLAENESTTDRRFNRLRLRLVDIRAMLRGDYNGDGFEELALIGDFNGFYTGSDNLQLSTLESRAYEILDSKQDYTSSTFVNSQEGYSGMRTLDYPSNPTRNESNTFSYQETKNAIVDRYSSSITLNSNTFAVSGNFHPGSSTLTRDEILLFMNTGSNVENVTLFAYNAQSSVMDYDFTESTVYNSDYNEFNIEGENWVAVLNMVGDDDLDEVYILKRTQNNRNKIFSFRYDGSGWVFELRKEFNDMQLNFTKIRGISSGDFNGDGVPEIMLAYDDMAMNQKLLSIKMDNAGYPLTTFLNVDMSVYDFDKINSFIGGDFDGDGKSQVAMFYGNGLKEEIVMQKVNSSGTPYWESMLSASSNHIKFSNDIMKCVTSINIDYDVKGRDDIVSLYLDSEDWIDNGANFNSILQWISMPEFSENDFMISTLEGEEEVPFIFVGDLGVRLVSAIDTAAVGQLLYLGSRSDDFLYKHRKMFNTLVSGREHFCDKSMVNEFAEMPSGYKQYDFFDYIPISSGHPEKTYVSALKAYLNRADSFGYKVIPFIDVVNVFGYEKSPPPFSNNFHKYTDFSGGSSTWPDFFRYIFELDAGQGSDIRDHSALLAYLYLDEPHVQSKNNSLDSNSYGMNHYPNHFWRDRVGYQSFYNYPTTAEIEDITVFRNMCKNVYDELKNHISKPVIQNYNSYNEYEFNNEVTDAFGHDFYPYVEFTDPSNTTGQTKYMSKRFPSVVNSYTSELFENMVRFDKEFIYHWVQGFPQGEAHTQPKNEYLRYALFGSTIKGMRGHFNFQHYDTFNNDTMFQRSYHTYQEYNFYLDWFKTESLKHKVSTSCDLFSVNQGIGSGGKKTMVNADLYLNGGIYILVVSNANEWKESNDVDFVIDENLSSGTKVYNLSPDYFENGVYREINVSSYSPFLKFSDNVEKRQIKIYAIGGLPEWNKPDEWIDNAEFGNSNQRQFVAFPKIEDNADPNLLSSYKTEEEVYYHTVYQRLENERYNIYYRRSKPVIKGEDTEESPEGKLLSSGIIQWEPEILVSSKVIMRNTYGPENNTLFPYCYECEEEFHISDARNPSLIVDKRDANEEAKVRIYFNAEVDYSDLGVIILNHPFCGFPLLSEKNIIAEVEIPAFGVQSPVYTANQIASYNGNLTDYGNPVVNSCYDGNFIAWSDSEEGIMVGYRDGTNTCFSSMDLTSVTFNNIHSDARHPSINPYSKKSEKHRDIGLVWQEKQTEQPESSFEIYYTRVGFMDSNKTILQHFITDPSSTYYPHNHGFIIHPTKKILELSTGYETNTHTKPIIVRNVEIVTRPGDTWVNRHHKFDRVYWESVNFSTNKKFISFASMDYYDEWNYQTEYMYEDMYFYAGPDRIGGVDVNLKSPNNTNGIMSYDKPTNSHSDISDSIQVLNFIQEGSGNNNTIWYLNTGYWDLHNHWYVLGSSTFYNYDDDDDPSGSLAYHNRDSYIQKVMGTGDMPQIPVSPHTIGRLNWYFTKRLFEFDRNGTKEIVPSIEHFLKPTFGSISEYPIILNGFTDDEEYSDMYSSLEVKTKSGNVIEIPLITQDSLIRSKKNQDVMYTPYFYLDSLNEIDFYQSGHILENKTNVYLERKEDNKKVKLNLNRFNNMKLEKNNYLVRGNKRDVYRLVIENKNKSNSRNVQELLISGIPDPNSIDSKRFYKSNFQEKGFELVDFKDENFTTKLNLNLYPNPSSNKFNILTDIPKNISDFKLKYTLFDLNGLIIDEFSSSQLNIEYNLENINLKYFYIKVEMIDCNDCSIKSDMKLMIKK